MVLGLFILHATLATLLPEVPSETASEETSFKNKSNEAAVAFSQSAENMSKLNKELTLVQAMIKDLEKQNAELKEAQEKNAQTVKNEVLTINKRLFQEKQKYLQIIKELQNQNLELKNFSQEQTESVKLEISAINEQLLKEKQEHAQEIAKLKKLHEEAVKHEISTINERITEEKKQQLQQVSILENDLTLVSEKLSWLDESAIKKFSNQVGELIATAAFPEYEVAAAPPAAPAMFHYLPEIEKQKGYVGVEFLWWKAYEGALDYAIKGQVGGNQDLGGIGKLKSASFEWAPGYRAYLGYRFPPDFWEVEAIYTYYHNSHHNKASHPKCSPPNNVNGVPPEKALVGTFIQYTTTPVDIAKSSITLNYNMGDILLGRRLAVTKALILRGLFGISGVWLDQHWKYTYLPGLQISNGVSEKGSTVKGKENWKFSAGGFRLGLDMNWFIGKGFTLLTDGSLAVFFGPYSNLSFNKTNNHLLAGGGQGLPQVTTNLKINDHRFSMHTRLAIMPAWGKQFNHFGFLVYAGYELNLFTNLQEVYRSSADTASYVQRLTSFTYGLLGMQGLTAGINFDF
ncbi:MAG: Lpg1974 family pore-forming outer membrane protein [Chlamydiota bacterium]